MDRKEEAIYLKKQGIILQEEGVDTIDAVKEEEELENIENDLDEFFNLVRLFRLKFLKINPVIEEDSIIEYFRLFLEGLKE